MQEPHDLLDEHINKHDGDEHWASETEEGRVCYACACEAVQAARLQGLEEGLRMYAHWKDGVEYVGTCGRTLASALEDVRKRYG